MYSRSANLRKLIWDPCNEHHPLLDVNLVEDQDVKHVKMCKTQLGEV